MKSCPRFDDLREDVRGARTDVNERSSRHEVICAVGLENSARLSYHPFAPSALSQLLFGLHLRYALIEGAATRWGR
jgi:hypothetical protein